MESVFFRPKMGSDLKTERHILGKNSNDSTLTPGVINSVKSEIVQKTDEDRRNRLRLFSYFLHFKTFFFFCHHLLVSLSFIKTSGANLQPSVIADWTQRDMCNAIVEFWCWYVVVLCAALFFPRGSTALNLLLGFPLRLWQTLWTRLWTYFRHKKR